jgi:acyl-coenzyme A synthetase/AMP-(fatty) acid ligase
VEVNIETYDRHSIAMTDGSGEISYGELTDMAYAIAGGMVKSKRKRWHLDGVTDLHAIVYMYAAYLSGKELMCLPSFIPSPVRKMLAVKYGAYSNVRSVEPSVASSFPANGRVASLTSGTTGNPKMVAFSSRVFSHNDYGLERFGIGDREVVYVPAPQVAAPVPHLMSLSTGATVLIEPNRSSADRAANAGVVMTTPGSLNMFMDMPRKPKSIVTATSPLSQEQISTAIERGIDLHDIYTSTETGIVASRSVLQQDGYGLYGDVQMDLLSEDDCSTGILSVKSSYTMSGEYASFRYQPASEWVQNGDLVTVAGGQISKIVRSTGSKVKVSGMSVYTDLICATALQLPGVLSARVDVIRSTPDDHVILNIQSDLSESTVLKHLAERLPWYAVPRSVVYN